MTMESLNELISAAQRMLNTGFDVNTFMVWETMAFVALLSALGPSHYYTQTFKQLTVEKSPKGLLAAGGILVAAKEEILKTGGQMQADETRHAG
jgi:hypothetical protein